jgi:hypothetical protein
MEHQRLDHEMHWGVSHTWRSSNVKMFVTENTSGKRMIMDEHEKWRVRMLTHENRMYNRICYDSQGQHTAGLGVSASSVWRV